jgi:hypothetical protein
MRFLTNYIDKINYKLGILIFHNSNTFSNNIYNKLFKKKICNLNSLKHNFIKEYFENGYAEIGKVDKTDIDKINKLLSHQNPKKNFDNPQFRYKVTPEIYQIVKNIFDNQLNDQMDKIEEFYNQRVILTYLGITRNYHSNKKDETYSNFFHTDGYVYNMFKIFIKIQNVTNDDGPLNIVKKKYAKKFIKKLNYKNRNSYDHSNEHKYENFFFKNTGEAGEVLLCNTTELLHRAGNPIERNHRDMISLHFVAWPTKQKISKFEFKDMIFDDRMIKDFSKIKGIRNLIKYYNKNLMYKLKTN